jgi:nucleoside permease NupC
VNRLGKVSKELVRWLGVFVILCISFLVAGEREPIDGFRYFVTALVVSVVLWAVYCMLVYLLPFARSRFFEKE